MALKDKEFWSNIDLKGHLGRFFSGLTSSDYEAATDKTTYKRKVPLDDGTWKSVDDLGNSDETITSAEITEDSMQLSPATEGTSYTLHSLFVKMLSNIKYLFSYTATYIVTMSGQCTSSNVANRTITAAVHKKGTHPQVQVVYQGNVVRTGILINSSGDVIIEWANNLTIDSTDPLYIYIK
ncbi:MAG: hypothetical protein IJ759_00055 [Bacteroidales bacterium]|nr:hypothetical protein [Bacteroidales bacterium]